MFDRGAYRLLLVEQGSLPVEEELRASAVLGSGLICRAERWNERLDLSALLAGGVDLILPIAARDGERATRLFSWLREQQPPAPTLAVLPTEVSCESLAAANGVVDDFLLWPFRCAELDERLLRVLHAKRNVEEVRHRLNREVGLANLIGADPAFLRTIASLPRVAASDGTVLISGETGTGKELCARAIHHLGPRRNFPFVPVDCAGLPADLLENELFGHARGAFTDARSDQKGLAALAEGGTLFLDEIDALSPASQAKLLRFLEDHTYKALGAERFARANVRVVAATNQDLEKRTREQRFRADLFFRLCVFHLRMMSLRERREDVPILAQHFVETLDENRSRPSKVLSPSALRALTFYDWPGNVRELRNEIQRALALAEGPQILPADLRMPNPAAAPTDGAQRFREARSLAISRFEKDYLTELLAKHQGNITRAARDAGKDRRALGRLVKKHHLGKPPA
jgi:DNA-binding NtrC family response regulator